jgi:Cys-tRNA(Pro)/Cys-tRNA(Cys) deacylase
MRASLRRPGPCSVAASVGAGRAGAGHSPEHVVSASGVGTVGSYASGVAGRGTPATTLLVREGVRFTVHPYEVDPRTPSYGEAAAAALGMDPARVFKTLVAAVDGRLVVGVVPVSSMLDLKALAAAVGGRRAAMAEESAAERATGYVVGGISPLGQRTRLPTVIDSSAGDWPTIYVSAGRRGMQVELAPADLIRLTDATSSPIARS